MRDTHRHLQTHTCVYHKQSEFTDSSILHPCTLMEKNEESGSPGWGASFFTQTTEDVTRALLAAAAAASAPPSSRPSVLYSSKDDTGGHLQKLQNQVFKVLKGLSHSTEEKKTYNPEVLTSQKRQWASFQLQTLHRRILKEPSNLFESFVVVGLNPDCDIQSLEKQYFARNSQVNGQHQSMSTVDNLEPQVLFVYPPDKQLPLKSTDLISFCFPGGLEVNAVERTPSMSELNEILLGQEHLKQSDLSFVFRLQGADDSILYGCCLVADELVQKPSRLLSSLSDRRPIQPVTSRRILTTRRCYCILTRLPFFDLHFGVLNSISTEERLERLRQSISGLDIESCDEYEKEVHLEEEKISGVSVSCEVEDKLLINGTTTTQQLNHVYDDSSERHQIPNAILPLLRYQQYDSSESSSSLQGSPSDDRNFRGEIDNSGEMEETSFSSQEDSEHERDEILNWAKANNHGSLQIICEYYGLNLPTRGSKFTFHPLDHLHPLEFHRPDETILHIAGSTIDLMSCTTSFELAEAHSALAVEEEATALSVWAIACLCGSLNLEHVLTIFAGALLEKQIVFVCSNLGILSATVLSIIPLIRPYHWQSFLMPVLPNDMVDFLDAPVPFVVGVKQKTAEVQSKSANVIFVDANKNHVKSVSLPKLPRHKELLAALNPYHAQLVGESYLGKRRPVHDCTNTQVEAAKGFLTVLRSYLDSLCSNLRSHTITNVQSNDDKVSLLLKESFIDSFPSRDRPFMKLFVETQLFSVHTDLVLSFFQKD
ncbi:hypothetical protein LXL04_018588 [Taraxacum kok-saghyz]